LKHALAFDVLYTQHCITKSQNALSLQVVDENVILRKNALNDVTLSCEGVFNLFFSISIKDEVLVSFSRF
jgi:hypothetical protein